MQSIMASIERMEKSNKKESSIKSAAKQRRVSAANDSISTPTSTRFKAKIEGNYFSDYF